MSNCDFWKFEFTSDTYWILEGILGDCNVLYSRKSGKFWSWKYWNFICVARPDVDLYHLLTICTWVQEKLKTSVWNWYCEMNWIEMIFLWFWRKNIYNFKFRKNLGPIIVAVFHLMVNFYLTKDSFIVLSGFFYRHCKVFLEILNYVCSKNGKKDFGLISTQFRNSPIKN